MHDEFMNYFGWIKELLNRDFDNDFPVSSIESTILYQLKNDWKADNFIDTLNSLEKKFGEKAKSTITNFMKLNIERDWSKIGEKEANEKTEIEDFIRVLWEPLQKIGFEYELKKTNQIIELTVTRCPIYNLAEKTGKHEWFYHLACSADYFTTPSFSKKIGFTRTKTLMQGDKYCNYTYYYKDHIAEDMLLGYCGLFCGNCPNYQKTDAIKPVQFNKDDYYEPCTGCNSKIKATHCANCLIMQCNKSRNTRICYDCSSFTCSQMDDFINDGKYPYHKYVETNMKLLKEKGLNEWVTIQKTKNFCKGCNSILNFFETKCSKCGLSRNME